MWKSNLSLSTPGMSPAIKAIKAMRYIWSAIDSGPFIPWLIHPFLFVVYGINTNTKFTTIHHFPILTNQATNLSSNLVSPEMWQLSIIAMQEAMIDLINEHSMMSAVSFGCMSSKTNFASHLCKHNVVLLLEASLLHTFIW